MKTQATSQSSVSHKNLSIVIPDFKYIGDNPFAESIMLAVFNNAIDEDKTLRTKEITFKVKCLKNILKGIDDSTLDPDIRNNIIPSILLFADKEKDAKYSQYGEGLEYLIKSKKFNCNHVLVVSHLPLRLFKLAIENGADINYNINGFNILFALARHDIEPNLEEIISLAIQKGANLNSTFELFNSANPLHFAISEGYFNEKESQSFVKTVMRNLHLYPGSFDWNQQDKEGNAILTLAAKMNCTDLIKIILEHKSKGADINVNLADKYGRTALHFVSALGNIEAVELLIKAGADINQTDTLGRIPLHFAVFRQKLVTDILQESKINPERDQNALSNYLIDHKHLPVTVLINILVVDKIPITKQMINLIGDLVLSKIIAGTQDLSSEIRDFNIKFQKLQMNNLTGVSLIESCMKGHVKVVKFLVSQNNINCNIANINGDTAQAIVKKYIVNSEGKELSALDNELYKEIHGILESINIDYNAFRSTYEGFSPGGGVQLSMPNKK